ncbi:ATP-binding protein [Streptomyces sp. H27-H1]|uniref:ATP-binding protein n=1 Tax=Streptomyces sp. H27-H1 TaxID=2996461 RepID=UPI00226E67F1|nr:ATP-binding protein [Streptomyces sp. H27-H1]MCY0932104.1 ATP-binding protein [Streptomyces sp. H27-H1]
MPSVAPLLDLVSLSGGQPPRIHRRNLSTCIEPARAARRFVREALDAYPCVDDVALVAGELVANAAEHTPGADRLVLEVYGETLAVLTVCDRGVDPRAVAARTADPQDTDGRGLLLVSALAAGWFAQPVSGGGTGVSAVFDLSARAAG